MSTPTTINFAQASNLAMDEALGLDDSVFLLGEDIADREGGGVAQVTTGLSTKYGVNRVRSTPISEQAIAGAAVGAAIAGMRPVAEIMLMNFITVAMDQIVNHAAKIRFMSGGQTSVPLTIRTMSGAGMGSGGQHSDMLEAWLAHVPGLKVVTGSSPAEVKGLLLSCILDDDPCVFVECMPQYWTPGPAPEPGLRIPLGKANVLREGSDVSVISYGRPIADIVLIAESLAGEGINVEIVDLRTISPLDETTVLNSVGKTKRAVIVHEAIEQFGVGAQVSARIGEELHGELLAPTKRVASRNSPVPFAKVLENEYLYKAADIEGAIRKAVS
ncbi:alpha-ketoacid dehydrogenase subunit beta [Mycolicibacterium hodleri]|uniref:3-methyl-2-oxobutanoate dehydrogenase subunit beta n=1 Tax=Mycolicibacterium hodleri TaxID=49897 RepID=A0A502EG80_9MYCO|nr:transketolase C-terminal domain-containing protein [Mycolicibacterium hodleri]TPG36457.1 alpha-ketoacid dehydrogenase subunit beta [Mycolicibacterium hodleri]